MLAQRGLIKGAMTLAAGRITKDEFDLSSEIEALDFRPERVLVRDSLERLVIAGCVEGQRIFCCDPVSSQGEAAWDNYCTSEHLRLHVQRCSPDGWSIPSGKSTPEGIDQMVASF